MDRTKKFFCFLGRMCLKARMILFVAFLLYACCAIALHFVDPLFHTHQHIKWVEVKAPTCTEFGLEENRCYCGETITRRTGYAAHTFGQWNTDRLPTESQAGQRTRYCIYCNSAHSIPIQKTDPSVLGSAGWIGNTTVVVSIFAGDQKTAWYPNYPADQARKTTMLETLQTAITWITDESAKYDAYPNFIYDWREDPDLSYNHAFWQLDFSVTRKRDYKSQRDYILEKIPSQMLLERYQAQNIIYLFFFNTDSQNISTSYGYYDHPSYDLEVINLFDDYLSKAAAFPVWDLPPTLIALLLLRSFGVPPLWCESAQIPEGYRTHLNHMGPRDIMQTYTYIGGSIINYKLTEFDAYFLGLIDDFTDANTWGLQRTPFY